MEPCGLFCQVFGKFDTFYPKKRPKIVQNAQKLKENVQRGGKYVTYVRNAPK
jgi:hypothetical protein